MPRSAQQLGLLGWGDAGGRAAEHFMAAHAHFDKYQGAFIAHDQIDFAKAAAIVLCQQNQMLALQIRYGDLLGITALHFPQCLWVMR